MIRQFLADNTDNIKKYGIRTIAVYLMFVLIQITGTGRFEIGGILHSFFPFIGCAVLINLTAYFAADEKQFAKVFGGLMFLYLSINIIKFLVDVAVPYAENEYYICFCTGIACTLLLITMLLNRCVFINLANWIFWLWLLLPVAVLWNYYFATGHWYSAESYWEFRHASFAAAIDYVLAMRWYVIPLIVIFAVMLIRFIWKASKLKPRSVNLKQFIAIFLLLTATVLMFQQHRDNQVMEIYYRARDEIATTYRM